MEGWQLEATVTGVQDLIGNTMVGSAIWEFQYLNSLFAWSQTVLSQSVSLGAPGTMSAELVNGTDQTVTYTVTSVPAFLTVAPDQYTVSIFL